MKKVALITDTHFDKKQGYDLFQDSQKKFIYDCFLPELEKRKITEVFHLGDLFDNRLQVTTKTLNWVYDLFKNDLSHLNFTILVGNHDSYFKNTIDLHSLKILDDLPNITVISDIQKKEIYNRSVLLVPWQPDMEDFSRRVSNKNIHCDICMGHFDISGFRMNSKKESSDGLDSNLFFENYGLVFSGHFHQRNEKKKGKSKIVYIGNPYHLDRHDINEERGFCILDFETLNYEYVNNTVSMRFERINFPEEIDENRVRGNIVDVVVPFDPDRNEDVLKEYLEKLDSFGPAETPKLTVISEIKGENEEIKEMKAKTIQELISEYMLRYNSEKGYERVEDFLFEIYNEVSNN